MKNRLPLWALVISLMLHAAVLTSTWVWPTDYPGEKPQDQKIIMIDDVIDGGQLPDQEANAVEKPKKNSRRSRSSEAKIKTESAQQPRALRRHEPKRVEEKVVVPIPNDKNSRWIVKLADIPEEKEPDEAKFVSERPSRVKEEVQAAETSEDPKPVKRVRRPRRNKAVDAVANPSFEAKPATIPPVPNPNDLENKTEAKNENKTAPVSNIDPKQVPAAKAENPVKAQDIPEELNKPEIKTAQPVESKNAYPASETTSKPPEGVPPGEPSAGGVQTPPGKSGAPGKPGDDIENRKKIIKKNLMPSTAELARNVPPGGGAMQKGGAGGLHSDSEVETGTEDGVSAPRAPENFIPMVKKRGGITLLNAKSYQFSAFVRRVAHRIFDRFVVGFNPRHFGGADFTAMQRGATYEAVINMSGRSANIKRLRGSGSENFDSLARSAMSSGAWDTNVPDGAQCADGFVHFLFIPKIIPAGPASGPGGEKVYTDFMIMAVAGISDCD